MTSGGPADDRRRGGEALPPGPPQVPGYRLLRELGRGGMGVVWLALQERTGREVALKLLRWDAASAEQVPRFEREVRILGRLDHPGLARIYEAGTIETPRGPRPWYSMPAIDGQPLDRAARDLDPRRIAELFTAICDALHSAHDEGVVHRDLKPSNVLVTPAGRPVVLDFGVALLGGETAEARATLGGELPGTLSTVSPEQTLGGAAELDRRADVYSLGAMLYELWTGQPAVQLAGGDPVEILRRIREVDPPPAGRLRRELAGDSERILAKALEKDPQRRYASAADLAADLTAWLEQRPIAARPAAPLYQASKLVRRHRLLFGALGGALAVLLVALVGSLAATRHARRAEAAAEREARESQSYRRALELSELERRCATLWPATPENLAELEELVERGHGLWRELAALDSVDAVVPGEDWRPDAGLAARAQAYFDPRREHGGHAELERRRDRARALYDETIGNRREAWRAAAAAIRTSPRYGGLELVPQLGLIPLGPDPDSQLWEFAHWGPSGELPEREPGRRLEPSAGGAIVLVLIPGGRLFPGGGAEPPAVELDPFFLSKYELTQGQWRRVLHEYPSYSAPGDELEGHPFCERHPVEEVNWLMAAELTWRLDLVLPTEAQFEYAQRAGTRGRFWTGAEPASLRGSENVTGYAVRVVFRDGEGPSRTWPGLPTHAPVGVFRPNPWGLFDMAGNVAEWCRDPWSSGPQEAQPRPGDGLRVPPPGAPPLDPARRACRGGDGDGHVREAASSARRGRVQTFAGRLLGLRVARPVDARERGRPGG